MGGKQAQVGKHVIIVLCQEEQENQEGGRYLQSIVSPKKCCIALM